MSFFKNRGILLYKNYVVGCWKKNGCLDFVCFLLQMGSLLNATFGLHNMIEDQNFKSHRDTKSVLPLDTFSVPKGVINGAIPPLEECCWTLAILEGMPLKVSFAIERASTSKRKVVKIQPFYPRQKAWILLDGHHKVEAAARLGCSLNFLILGSWSNVCFLWIKKIGKKS